MTRTQTDSQREHHNPPTIGLKGAFDHRRTCIKCGQRKSNKGASMKAGARDMICAQCR